MMSLFLVFSTRESDNLDTRTPDDSVIGAFARRSVKGYIQVSVNLKL